MDTPHLIFDRALLAKRRDRLRDADEQTDFLNRRVADDIAERLAFVRRSFPIVLDLGAGSGVLGRRLETAGIGAEMIISADLSPRLLANATGPKVVADEELLPFRDGSLDLVVSGLALQLVNDLPGALVQIRRALRPDGLMIAALLGGQTLMELREAFVVAETETIGGASPRVAPFADVRDLGALVQRAGFALPVADSETLEVGYASALDLMRDLRAVGWTNVLADRRRAPLRKATLARAVAVYQDRHGRPDGRVKATFEIITLTGWAPHESQQKPLRPGSAAARLADALGTNEQTTGDNPEG
jgi:SAM-dependent methyltransferase